jgi:hypothetical protein
VRPPTSDYSDAGLRRRWNLAATDAGFAGSEFVDEPEFVMARIELKNAKIKELHFEVVRLRRLMTEVGDFLETASATAARRDEPEMARILSSVSHTVREGRFA